MYYQPYGYPDQNPNNVNDAMHNYGGTPNYWINPNGSVQASQFDSYGNSSAQRTGMLRDFGPNPIVINITEATKQNDTFRTALWTGTHLQTTLMSLGVGEDIGLEVHPDVDQFIRIEQGQGITQMGKTKENLNFRRNVYDDTVIIIPAGSWHNLTNTGNIPLKLYSIYAPPNHSFGTIHRTKADAMAEEQNTGYNNQNTGISGQLQNGYNTRYYW